MENSFIIKELTDNFEKRNIEVLWFNTFGEIKEYLLDQIPNDSNTTVGIGNSKTLKAMEITKALSGRGNRVFDKTFGSTQEEIRELKRSSLLADTNSRLKPKV